MAFRKVLATSISAVMLFSSYAPVLADEIKAGKGYDVEVKASTNVEDLYAPYDEITLTCKDGGTILLECSGSDLIMSSACCSNMTLRIDEFDSSVVLEQDTNSNYASVTVDDLDVNELYSLDLVYTGDGENYRQQDIVVTKDEDGNARFVKSQIYDFNVERCSELWTDEDSLAECLLPQNDVECDDPAVIYYAEQITADCDNDWEKVYAIYTHITNEFAYDYIQCDDDSMVYQDDVLSLLRRKIAICEGMGNTFTALCRAVGVPAAVSFGLGEDVDTMINGSDIVDDEYPNHAWAVVFLDGTWYHVDPTWDGGDSYEGNSYYDGEIISGSASLNNYLLPLEVFSMTHKICDADTYHGIESSGSCGDNATYEITRDGTITIYGSGEIVLPDGVNGFRNVVFDPDSNITTIGERCFRDCDIITSIILPDTVTRIERKGFVTCEDLEYIYLPDGLTYIGESAFDYCDELAYVYVPDSVTEIGTWAFDDCPRLIISIPEDLEGFDDGNYVDPYMIILRDN